MAKGLVDKELADLIKGCKKRNRSSQKLLYMRFYSFGMSISYRYTSNRDEAAEVLNDAFLNVFKSIDSFRSDLPFLPWFKRIVVNTSINHYKKEKRRKESTSDVIPDTPVANTVISGINYEELVAMVQLLTPAYRSVFNLYVIEGYTHQEIAKMLGISEGTSKSNLFKAKARLRLLLSEHLNQNA